MSLNSTNSSASLTQASQPSNSLPSPAISSQVPCIVVDDIDGMVQQQQQQQGPAGSYPSASHRTGDTLYNGHQAQSSSHQLNPSSNQCSSSLLPRHPLAFKQIHLLPPSSSPYPYSQQQQSSSSSSSTAPYSFRLGPNSAWPIWFHQEEGAFVDFQFYVPFNTRLLLVGQRNEPPSFTSHQLLQVISDETLGYHQVAKRGLVKRQAQLLQTRFTQYFDKGTWYLSLVNDGDQTIPLVVNISLATNRSVHCQDNCNNHGHCHLGKCQCFPGFIGTTCGESKQARSMERKS